MTASIIDVRLLERARKEIGDAIDNLSVSVAAGMASDHADYKFRCGQIIGLRTSLEILSSIIKSMGDERH